MTPTLPGLGPIFGPLWIGIWGGLFAVLEGLALTLRVKYPNRTHNAGGTLSELIWRWIYRPNGQRRWPQTFAVAGFLSWLTWHLLFTG